jgi:hypothetical protein
MKTRAQAVMPLADLLAMDGASAAQEAWLAARAGEPGWFCGPAARATACAAQVTPVVTGSPDWNVLSEMADVFLDAHGYQEGGTSQKGTSPRTCGGCDCPPPGLSGPLSPAARLALERTLLAMSVRALSGPEGLAGFLRANLLGRPFNGASMVLDIGSTDDIPGHIRRAVILRDRHCQWPGGCDRPAAQCEPHHLRPPRRRRPDPTGQPLPVLPSPPPPLHPPPGLAHHPPPRRHPRGHHPVRQGPPQPSTGRQRSRTTGSANTRQPDRLIPRNATRGLTPSTSATWKEPCTPASKPAGRTCTVTFGRSGASTMCLLSTVWQSMKG